MPEEKKCSRPLASLSASAAASAARNHPALQGTALVKRCVRWARAEAGPRPFHSCGVWCVPPAPILLLQGWAPRRAAKQQADSPAGEKPRKCNGKRSGGHTCCSLLFCCHVKKDVFASPSAMMGSQRALWSFCYVRIQQEDGCL
ncbi:uncharacterized protein LOC144579124 [Callithrix jacchus]